MIHFKNVNEVLNVIRDMVTYISIQGKNDELGSKILIRGLRILKDNDNTNVGDNNESTKQAGKEDSDQWYEEIKYTNILTKWVS